MKLNSSTTLVGSCAVILIGLGASSLADSYQKIALYLGVILLFFALAAFLVFDLPNIFKAPPPVEPTVEKAYLDELWKATLAIQDVAQGYLPPAQAGPIVKKFNDAAELFLQFPEMHDLLLGIEKNCTKLAMLASPKATPDEAQRTALRTQALSDIETLKTKLKLIVYKQ